MAKTLQFRRGTTAELSSQTGSVGELFVDTDKDTVVVMDGSTSGGFPLARETTLTTAGGYANSAFGQANTAQSHAEAAYDQANTATTDAATADQKAVTSGSYANSAYIKANSAFAHSNLTYDHAQSGYDQANTATTNAATADQKAVSAGVYANAAYSQANTATTDAATADQKAVSAGVYANSAFNVANTAIADASLAQNHANESFNKANISLIHAESSYNLANTINVSFWNSFPEVNTKITSAYTHANSGYNQANTATTDAATADQKAVSAGSYANSAYLHANAAYTSSNTKFSSSGGTISGSVTISQDLTVTGNLTIGGNTTSVSANNLVVNDSIIYLANNATGNTVDIGVVGHFIEGSYQHTGVIRDASDGKWKFFSNVASEPTTTVDFTDAFYDTVKVGIIEADTANVGNFNLVSYIGSAYAHANSAHDSANTVVSGLTAGSGITLSANTGNVTISSGVSITNEVSSATTYYPLFTNQTSGVITKANTSSPSLTWTPSSQTLESGQLKARSIVTVGGSFPAGAGTLNVANSSGTTVINLDGSTGIVHAAGLNSDTSVSVGSGGLVLSSIVNSVSGTATTSSTSTVTIDTFDSTAYRSAKYLIQMTSGSSYHMMEISIIHDGSTVYMSQFGEIMSGSSLAVFDAVISAGTLSLLIAPTNASTTIKWQRTTIVV